MKRSRIFLGATTALLAIAGIAAAKAHRIDPKTNWYYTKIVGGNAICTKQLLTSCVNQPQGVSCLYITLGTNHASFGVYTRGNTTSNFPCAVRAKYNIQ